MIREPGRSTTKSLKEVRAKHPIKTRTRTGAIASARFEGYVGVANYLRVLDDAQYVELLVYINGN